MSQPTSTWPKGARATLIAAGITGTAAILAALVGALNTTRSGQQITIGNIVSNVFNFQGTTINSDKSAHGSSLQRTTVGGPTVRFGIGANALVSAWDQHGGFRVFINGIDKGWQHGGKAFPVKVPPDKNCQIEFLGSPDDPAKGRPVNVEFGFSCQ